MEHGLFKLCAKTIDEFHDRRCVKIPAIVLSSGFFFPKMRYIKLRFVQSSKTVLRSLRLGHLRLFCIL